MASVKKNKVIPIPTNLIKQNCFIRECVRSDSSLSVPSSYVSCDEVTESDGIKIQYTEHDYPITPDSVNSYVDSSDYRRDPVGAVARGHHLRNLGDVSAMQEVSNMDMQSARVLYNTLSKVFSSKSSEASVPSASAPEAPVSDK